MAITTISTSGRRWLDAVASIGVGGAVIWSAWGLLREGIALNLDAAPRHVDLGQVEQPLASLPAVLEGEELHIWGLSTSHTALTADVLIDPRRLASEALSRNQRLTLARTRLSELGVGKSTLQLESGVVP